MNYSSLFRRFILITALFILPGAFAFGASPEPLSHDAYARVLERFVDHQGMVDYAGLQENSEDLTEYGRQLAAISPDEFRNWPEADQIALWINAYNALTLQLIIDHYPIRRRLTRALFPVGIRHIPGNWDGVTFNVMGRELTLNDIEHEILRVDYEYPAIHMSLVCAAMDCPPLRTEPYVGNRLDEQHDDQAKQLIAHPNKFRIDHENQVVHLSSIFDWFGEDFIPTHGDDPAFRWGDEKEQAVMTYLASYLDDEDVDRLKLGTYEVDYLDYDWSLNDQS